jgi:hypothetical protein
MDFSQQNSVFMPGLTRRGPVYNANPSFGSYLSALPTVSPGIKTAIIAALILAGVTKKIPLYVAGVGAFAIWNFLPDGTATPTAPITANINPTDLTSVAMPDFSNLQAPVLPSIASQ